VSVKNAPTKQLLGIPFAFHASGTLAVTLFVLPQAILIGG
jgi:hypothetical protein